ncbi:MAG TPA: 1-deoxy-D-xylulose-5-phosphate synthase N-terminal domain-containing protein [Caballeronia sp.]|nr:1-deoxy-D-xylulose-5-phosphate synthase N-terminal domain-containing protein [Caballeronia sp.]
MRESLESVARRLATQCRLLPMAASPEKYALLESIDTPADLRRLAVRKLAMLAEQLRQFLVRSAATRGGHFAAGLGTVELTIALHCRDPWLFLARPSLGRRLAAL